MATGVSPLPLPHQEGEGEQFHHQSTTLPNKSISQSNSKKPIFNQPKHYQPLQFINDPGISYPSFKQSPSHELSNDLSNPSNYPPSSIFATLKQTSHNQTNQPSTNLNQSVEDKGNDLALPQLSYMEVVKGCSSKRVNSSMGFTNLQDSDMESISLKPISMYQGKPAVMFSLSEKHSLVEKLKFVLVGKFSHGMPSMVKVRNFFKSIKLKEFCNVSFFDKKHIFIECSCKADYNFIWLNLSWVIDGFAMRILKWTPEFHPVKESPVVPVWIRIEGLPLYLFNERSLLSIANTVGKPIKVDPRNVARTMLNSARVCVELDISKPFVDTLWISFEDEISKEIIDGFWVKLLYDVVPPYCGFCSHIGHSIGRCKRRNEEALAVGKYVEKGGAAPVGLGHGEVGDGGSAVVAGRAAVYAGCGGKAGHAAGDAEPADLVVQIGAGTAGAAGAAGDSTKFSLLHTRKNEPANAMTEQATAGVETVAGQIVQELAGQIEQVEQENLAVEDSDQEKIQVCNKEVKADFLLSYSSAVLVEEQDKDVAMGSQRVLSEGSEAAAGKTDGDQAAEADSEYFGAGNNPGNTTAGVLMSNGFEQVQAYKEGVLEQARKSAGQVKTESWADQAEKSEKEEFPLENTRSVGSQDEDSDEEEINGTLVDLHKQVMGFKGLKEGHREFNSSKEGHGINHAEQLNAGGDTQDLTSSLSMFKERMYRLTGKERYLAKAEEKGAQIRIVSQLSQSEIEYFAQQEIYKIFATPTSDAPVFDDDIPFISNPHVLDKEGKPVSCYEIIEKAPRLVLARTSLQYPNNGKMIARYVKNGKYVDLINKIRKSYIEDIQLTFQDYQRAKEEQEWTPAKRRGRNRNRAK